MSELSCRCTLMLVAQGFFFSEIPKLGYGLVQTEGGPCGPLASVNVCVLTPVGTCCRLLDDVFVLCACQAYVIRNLLFAGKAAAQWDQVPCRAISPPLCVCCVCPALTKRRVPRVPCSQPSSEAQCAAVCDALVEILWQARAAGRPAVMCVEGGRRYVGRTGAYKPDGFTEKLVLYTATTRDKLAQLVRSQLPVVCNLCGCALTWFGIGCQRCCWACACCPQFMKPDGRGCCLFVYSVMLTRTIEGIKSDMDNMMGEPATLIGAHNYATQACPLLLLLRC